MKKSSAKRIFISLLLITALTFAGLFVIATGWVVTEPYHEPLYADTIRGKSGSTITINDGPLVINTPNTGYSAIDFNESGVGKWGFGLYPTGGADVNRRGDFYIDQTGVANRLTIDQGGNVGIGINHPDAGLDILTDVLPVAGGARVLQLEGVHSSAVPGSGIRLDFVDAVNPDIPGDDVLVAQFRTDMDGSGQVGLSFSTFDGTTLAERVRFLSDGSVGIGTSSPDAGLDVLTDVLPVAGGARALQLEGIHSSAVPGSGIRLDFVDAVNPDIPGDDVQVGRIRTVMDGLGAVAMAFHTYDSGTASLNEVVRFGSNGNVGIGTTTPSRKLDVEGDVRISGMIYGASPLKIAGGLNITSGALYLPDGSSISSAASLAGPWTSSGNNVYLNDLSNNVGIGTIPTNAKLHVDAGSADFSRGIYSISTGDIGAGVSGWATGFGGIGVSGISITGAGVHGKATDTGIGGYFESASGSGLIVASGNVGIGTTTPENNKLRVIGNINASGDICTDINGNCLSTVGSGELPTGAVMYFNLASCPIGWNELLSARGRYIVGLPSGGDLAGTTGTALSNNENRAVGQHRHSISQYGDGDSNDVVRVGQSNSYQGSSYTAYTGSVAGTNAPYIQLLVCQKD